MLPANSHSYLKFYPDIYRSYLFLTFSDGQAPTGSAINAEGINADTTLVCRLASGTKQYLAPEVFTSKHVHGAEMDFWALGVVAYELLHGKRPFDKHCPREMIAYLEQVSVRT